MSVRLKLLLAILVAGAVGSAWYVAGSSSDLSGPSGTATIAAQMSPRPACGDEDSDGLCDIDEVYWNTDYAKSDTDGDGFLDGEEVLTGHDPAKAGPDDYLDQKRNLTQHISALMLGAVVSGTLDKNNPDYDRVVDELVTEMFDQYDANVATELDSVILASDSESDFLAYGITVNNILEQMFSEIAANYTNLLATAKDVPINEMPKMKELHPEAFKAFTLAADAETTAFNERAVMIKSVRVPPSMQKFHTSLLLYLRGTQQRYRTLKTIDQDPLTALISLQVIRTLALMTPLKLLDSFQNSYANAALNLP